MKADIFIDNSELICSSDKYRKTLQVICVLSCKSSIDEVLLIVFLKSGYFHKENMMLLQTAAQYEINFNINED